MSPAPIPQSPIAAPCHQRADAVGGHVGRACATARAARRAGGCAGSSQQSGPQGGQAHLVQDCPLEDQVEQRGADSRVDRKRLAQLLHGFGDLPTRRGRRRGADYRLRSRQRRAFARVFAAGSSDGVRARADTARACPCSCAHRSVGEELRRARAAVGARKPHGALDEARHDAGAPRGVM